MSEVFAGPVPCAACRVPLPEGERVRCRCGRQVQVWRFRPFRRETPPSPMLDGATAPCAYHAGNRAETTCARCGSFLCALCATPVAGQTYCTACFERLRAAGEVAGLRNRLPRPHVVATLFGLGSVAVPVAGIIFVPLAIRQGVRALRDRKALGEREGGVIFWTVIAFALCLLGLALLAGFIAALLQ